MKPARPVRLVAGAQIGIDQDVRRPHDTDERIDQSVTHHCLCEPTNPGPVACPEPQAYAGFLSFERTIVALR